MGTSFVSKANSFILCTAGVVVGRRWGGGCKVELEADILANVCLSFRVRGNVVVQNRNGGKVLLQKFWLMFFVVDQNDFSSLEQDRTLSFKRLLKASLNWAMVLL